MNEAFISRLEPVFFKDILATLPPLDQMADHQLQRLCEVREQIEDRKKKYKLLYYVPQTQQLPFHKSQKKIRLACGTNQSGKSVCGIVEGLQISLGIHPYHKRKLPTRGRVIAADLQKGVGEVIQSLLDEWLPMGEVRSIKKGPTGVVSKIYFKCGSTIDFMSNEQDDQSFEGWVGDWVWADEPMQRSKYTACLRGLMKRKGRLWMTMTPLTEPWIYDEIFMKDGDPDIDVFFLDILKNPYISPDEVRIFKSKLKPSEIEARLKGRFPHLAGLIHKTFNPKDHVIDSFPIPIKWPRITGIDFHPRKPCSIVWVAVSPHDRLYVYDELVIDATVEKIAEMMLAKEKLEEEEGQKIAKNDMLRLYIKMRWIDPLSATPDRITGSCSLREFGRCKVRCRGWLKNFSVGRNAIDEYLGLDKEGKRALYFIRERVPQTINSYLHYQWGNTEEEKPGGEKPKQPYSDLPDALRGIVTSRPKFTIPEKDRPEEKYDAHKYTGYGH